MTRDCFTQAEKIAKAAGFTLCKNADGTWQCLAPKSTVPSEERYDTEAEAWFAARTTADKAAPDLLAVLRDLLDWEAHMGGWDAPCWQRARQAVRKAGRRA